MIYTGVLMAFCENPPYRHSHKERAEMAKMKKVLSLVCFN